ncbi:MAG: RNA 2',3'-cyclic phosphodiesterase [Noviherbaspirillum sp.]
MTGETAALRLFFALWPDSATRAALAALQVPLAQQARGRLVAPKNLHLTMAFLGMQEAPLLPAILGVLDRMALPAMTLQVDCYGYFPRARIAWAGIGQPPAALLALHAELIAALRQCGIGHDRESAFRPHVTLMRNAAAGGVGAAGPVVWNAPQLALVQSTTTARGSVYRVLAQRAAS